MEKTIKIDKLQFEIYLTERKIRDKVTELALKISKDYFNKKPILLLTLKGAIIFAADLMRDISIPIQVETIIAKSYGTNTFSSGDVELIENKIDYENSDIIIIEDIVDTGRTMKSLIGRLQKFNPSSIEICTLLLKPTCLEEKLSIKYVGFEIDPFFVVGYGLDYAEEGRNLKDIYIKI
jgi:hypoxanthine phosphoribosyltransferase